MRYKVTIVVQNGQLKDIFEKEAEEWGIANGVFICKNDLVQDTKPGTFRETFVVPIEKVIQINMVLIEEPKIIPIRTV